MNYTLMHKDISVVTMRIDDATGVIAHIGSVLTPEHLPIGLIIKDGRPDRRTFNDWWGGCSIPASRQGIREALETMGVYSTQLLIDKCLGLSLSDQYWIRPENSTIEWNNVNFFENSFSEDVGNILFGATPNYNAISLMSPDNTSDGWLKKKWIISGGKRFLVKGGSNPFQQEPLNEVLATRIMQRLGVSHVSYSVKWEQDKPFSVCENFLTPQTELISALHILHTCKQPNHASGYDHFLHCCRELGIANAEDSINMMLVVDFLIANEDRHFNNFGAVRDATTLQWLGIAPVFDSGTSFWFDSPNTRIGLPNKCKPFRGTHDEQIQLVSSLDCVDLSTLLAIEDEVREIYSQSPFIDEERCNRLCRALTNRVKLFERECSRRR